MPYIGKTTDGFGVRNRFIYLASSGDTSVSGADANGATLTFTDGAYVDVYLNGVLLKPTTDYNTSTANTIAGLSALNTNDEVTVVVYDVFTVADMVSATSGGTFSGNVTFNENVSIDVGAASGSGLTVTRSDNGDNLSLISTDTDASGGPALSFYRNSASPADSDTMCTIRFEGNNDASQLVIYNKIRADISDASDGTEDGTLHIFNMMNGTERTMFSIKPDEVVFNEESQDVDFRIESNDSANMFVVDGGNNLVTLQNDSDTDYNTNQTASNTVLNLKNNTSGASNSVGLSFTTESNGEQYITAVQNSGNSRSDLTFGARNGGSRTEIMRIAGDGHLLLNMQTALQSAYLSIEGQGRTSCISLDADSSSGGLMDFRFGDSQVGNINTNGTITNYVTSSDYRLKENVSYDWDATTRLKQLKPARFNFKKDADTIVDGFLAHEVSSIVPEAISGTKDGTQDLGTIRDRDGNIEQENALEIHAKKDEGQTWTKTKTEDVYQGIDQSKLVPLLVKTIQELEARVTALESK